MDELKGGGNHLDFKYRGYDPRLGRFTSVDPLAIDYPYNSPYAFAENDVIRAMDLEGLEKVFTTGGDQLSDDQAKYVFGDKFDAKNTDVYTVDYFNENKTLAKSDVIYIEIGKLTNLNIKYDKFMALAGTIYAESDKTKFTWEEGAGIYSVLENRAEAKNSTPYDQAKAGGIYGWGEREKINSALANPDKKQAAFKGLIRGMLDEKDYSGGGYYWHGRDFAMKSKPAYKQFYQIGFDFTNTSHDLYKMGDVKSSNKNWDYKYQSTGGEGGTTFMKLTDAWIKHNRHTHAY